MAMNPRVLASCISLCALFAFERDARATSIFDYGFNGSWGPDEAIRMQDAAIVYLTAGSAAAALQDQGVHDFSKSYGAPVTESDVHGIGPIYVGPSGTTSFVDGFFTPRTLTGGEFDGFDFQATSRLDFGHPTATDKWTVTLDGDGSVGTALAPLRLDGSPVELLTFSASTILQFGLYDFESPHGQDLGPLEIEVVNNIDNPAFTGTFVQLKFVDDGVETVWTNTTFPTSFTIRNFHQYTIQVTYSNSLFGELTPLVPEPATLGLAAAGAFALARRARRT